MSGTVNVGGGWQQAALVLLTACGAVRVVGPRRRPLAVVGRSSVDIALTRAADRAASCGRPRPPADGLLQQRLRAVRSTRWSSGTHEMASHPRALLEPWHSLNELPERRGQPHVAKHLLRLFDRSSGEGGVESIAVPALRQRPHLSECRRGAAGGLVVLRPKESDVASSEHDVVPPPARRQRKWARRLDLKSSLCLSFCRIDTARNRR